MLAARADDGGRVRRVRGKYAAPQDRRLRLRRWRAARDGTQDLTTRKHKAERSEGAMPTRHAKKHKGLAARASAVGCLLRHRTDDCGCAAGALRAMARRKENHKETQGRAQRRRYANKTRKETQRWRAVSCQLSAARVSSLFCGCPQFFARGRADARAGVEVDGG